MPFSYFVERYWVSYTILLGMSVVIFPALNEFFKRRLLDRKRSAAFWVLVQFVEIVVTTWYVEACPDLGLILTGWWGYPVHILACLIVCVFFSVKVAERAFKRKDDPAVKEVSD